MHYPLTQEGVQAAFNAVASLHQVTIDRVTYDCSVSHALEGLIIPSAAEAAAAAAAPKATPIPPNQNPQNSMKYNSNTNQNQFSSQAGNIPAPMNNSYGAPRMPHSQTNSTVPPYGAMHSSGMQGNVNGAPNSTSPYYYGAGVHGGVHGNGRSPTTNGHHQSRMPPTSIPQHNFSSYEGTGNGFNNQQAPNYHHGQQQSQYSFSKDYDRDQSPSYGNSSSGGNSNRGMFHQQQQQMPPHIQQSQLAYQSHSNMYGGMNGMYQQPLHGQQNPASLMMNKPRPLYDSSSRPSNNPPSMNQYNIPGQATMGYDSTANQYGGRGSSMNYPPMLPGNNQNIEFEMRNSMEDEFNPDKIRTRSFNEHSNFDSTPESIFDFSQLSLGPSSSSSNLTDQSSSAKMTSGNSSFYDQSPKSMHRFIGDNNVRSMNINNDAHNMQNSNIVTNESNYLSFSNSSNNTTNSSYQIQPPFSAAPTSSNNNNNTSPSYYHSSHHGAQHSSIDDIIDNDHFIASDTKRNTNSNSPSSINNTNQLFSMSSNISNEEHLDQQHHAATLINM